MIKVLSETEMHLKLKLCSKKKSYIEKIADTSIHIIIFAYATKLDKDSLHLKWNEESLFHSPDSML